MWTNRTEDEVRYNKFSYKSYRSKSRNFVACACVLAMMLANSSIFSWLIPSLICVLAMYYAFQASELTGAQLHS